jgi:5S rRNA maturation endonuclease (ribonuclease M5)
MVRVSPTRDELLELLVAKKNLLTIVEGSWDKRALAEFGFSHIVMCEGLALYQVVELVEKGSRVQILTDLDAEGRKLYARLSSELRQRGVHVDDELREALFRTQLRQIEGLVHFLDRMATEGSKKAKFK